MPSKLWGEITYPSPNFNGCTVEVWKWTDNFLPHIVIDNVIICYGGIKLKKKKQQPNVSVLQGSWPIYPTEPGAIQPDSTRAHPSYWLHALMCPKRSL